MASLEMLSSDDTPDGTKFNRLFLPEKYRTGAHLMTVDSSFPTTALN